MTWYHLNFFVFEFSYSGNEDCIGMVNVWVFFVFLKLSWSSLYLTRNFFVSYFGDKLPSSKKDKRQGRQQKELIVLG